MWKLYAGRVHWVCCGALASRSTTHGCLGLAIQCNRDTHLQRFHSCSRNPGTEDPQNGTAQSNASNGGDKEATDTQAPISSNLHLSAVTRSRRSWGRSLSPLERVSQMLPPELISQEVKALREAEEPSSHAPSSLQQDYPVSAAPLEGQSSAHSQDYPVSAAPLEGQSSAHSQDCPVSAAPLEGQSSAHSQDCPVSAAPLEGQSSAHSQDCPVSAAPLEGQSSAHSQDYPVSAAPVEGQSSAHSQDYPVSAAPVEGQSSAHSQDCPVSAAPLEGQSSAHSQDYPVFAAPVEGPSSAHSQDYPVFGAPVEGQSSAHSQDCPVSAALVEGQSSAHSHYSSRGYPLLDSQTLPHTGCVPQYAPPPGHEEDLPPSQGTAFQPGDLVIAEFKRRHYTEFKKMFLLKDSGKLLSNWGSIDFREILGRLPGQKLRTSCGLVFLLKRPSLEEFVLLMKRGPTISYPKDITAMIMMMDISPGDVVLEAGSGSGGMSLFLSRAVGPSGHVYSFEVRKDHHAVAKKNFLRWKNAWEMRGKQPWPENVYFINKDIAHGLCDIANVSFDAVALDMLSPQVALPFILPNLKQGAVCVSYIANITQVVDLLEGIRCLELPFVCEKITEISLKHWLVAPSVKKDGSMSQRVEPQWSAEPELPNLEHIEYEESQVVAGNTPHIKPFGHVPYIARPLPWQTGHTAFLVQLRKSKAAPKHSEPEDST